VGFSEAWAQASAAEKRGIVGKLRDRCCSDPSDRAAAILSMPTTFGASVRAGAKIVTAVAALIPFASQILATDRVELGQRQNGRKQNHGKYRKPNPEMPVGQPKCLRLGLMWHRDVGKLMNNFASEEIAQRWHLDRFQVAGVVMDQRLIKIVWRIDGVIAVIKIMAVKQVSAIESK
jgi:hypothetical protein